MPTKHIDEKTWKYVSEATIRAIIQTKEHFKESDILRMLITKGFESITEDDYEKEARKKRKK